MAGCGGCGVWQERDHESRRGFWIKATISTHVCLLTHGDTLFSDRGDRGDRGPWRATAATIAPFESVIARTGRNSGADEQSTHVCLLKHDRGDRGHRGDRGDRVK